MSHTHQGAPEDIAFCPKCATPLITRLVGDRYRRACPSCNYIHFTDPKVGVGALVIKDGKILLIRRAMEPERGKWSLPAGFLDHGEDPQETAEREVFEETNLHVEISSLLDIYHNPNAVDQGGASIFILYLARYLDGELTAGDDADAAGFFGFNELPEIAFPSTKDGIKHWQQNISGTLE